MKYFWIGFWLFVTALVVSAAMYRPDTVDSTLAFVGTYLVVLSWTVFALLVAGAAVGGVIVVWLLLRRSQVNSLRQKDGHYPMQRVKTRDGRIVIIDPNLMVGAAITVDRNTGVIEEHEPAAGWQVQATIRALIERTRQAQAMFQGDDSRSSKYGSMHQGDRISSAAAKLLEAPKRLPEMPASPPPPPPAEVMVEAAPTPAVVRVWTPQDALNQNTRTKLAMGRTADGTLVKWNMVSAPHLRLHGMSQGSGKTNLAKTLAAGAARTGAQVIVLDRRRFKDWQAFQGKAELIDTRDPRAFATAVQHLQRIYLERDGMLGAAGAANIGKLDNPPPRIVAVISEFGALCAVAAADGVLDDVLRPLTLILREAGATGVHVIIEDQVVDQRWPRGISTNAEPVTGYLPQNYGAAGGYHYAHQLAPYTFHFSGAVFSTWPMDDDVAGLLARVRPVPPVVVDGQFTVSSQPVHGPVHEPVHGQFAGSSPEVDPPPLTVMNYPTTTDGWFEWTLENYLPKHPELLQVDSRGRGVGVKALGEAMAVCNGKDYDAMKGTASDVAKRLRTEVGLPGGERIGIDISTLKEAK
jgi:hypothetical protein